MSGHFSIFPPQTLSHNQTTKQNILRKRSGLWNHLTLSRSWTDGTMVSWEWRGRKLARSQALPLAGHHGASSRACTAQSARRSHRAGCGSVTALCDRHAEPPPVWTLAPGKEDEVSFKQFNLTGEKPSHNFVFLEWLKEKPLCWNGSIPSPELSLPESEAAPSISL